MGIEETNENLADIPSFGLWYQDIELVYRGGVSWVPSH
jgi:hypothetical protein